MTNTKDYWNKVAEQKNFTHKLLIEEINNFINKDSVILDVGCGYGRTLNDFYKLNYHNLTGIDYSENMISRAKKLNPQITYKLMSDNLIPFNDNSFDCIILFAVLTCIIENNDQIKIINEIYRVLKPDGVIYISDYLLNTDERNIQRYKEYKNKYENYGTFEIENNGIVRHHKKEWIQNIISIFKTIKYNELIHTTMNGNKSNGFYFIGKKECGNI